MREHDESANERKPGARVKQFLEILSEEARAFTREKPLEGLLLSFIAGLLVGELFRRPR